MSFESRRGKIKLLRSNDLGNIWGTETDLLRTEVIVQLDSTGDQAYGFELRPGDDNLPARLAMHSMLRDAFLNDLEVTLYFDIVEGKKNGHLRRVQWSR